MADDAKEEARILASLEGAKKNAQKNAFKKPVQQPPVQQQPVQQQKPTKEPGQMPAWKRQQMEKEQREQDRILEEERKRKEKAQSLSTLGGVVEESVVTLGGPVNYQDIEAKYNHNNDEGQSGIDATSVAKEVDHDAVMKMEEERLMNKVKNTAPLQKQAEVQQKRFEQQVNFGKKIRVTWIDRFTEKPLQSFDWYCTNDRLPLKAIMHEWKITNVSWADLEQPINLAPDGFSDMTFEGISNLKIFADRINQ